MILGVRNDLDDAGDETAVRFDALDAWSTPVVACTADTVLGLVQNSRRGLYAWPALAGSAFVFDEIHAYDDRLFGALLCFLQGVRGVPVLLMTASLPAGRFQAIRGCLERFDESMTVTCGPAELERLPRYLPQVPSAGHNPLGEVAAAVAGGANVLWVCNTVDRAMRFALAAETEGLKPLVYHSRFRYEDRVARHRDVIESFRESRGVLAVCTQVAEVSLDISADLLVTDLAPVPALIQRLGRLNRRATPPPAGEALPPAMPFVIVEPGTPYPYGTTATPDPFGLARRWLQALGTGPLSQLDLAAHWEKIDNAPSPDPVPSAWLDGGPETRVLELREGTPGITVVLESDAYDVRCRRKGLPRVALPMPPPPKELDWRSWDRVRGCFVAPHGTIQYDRKRGAAWVRA